jgi:hypothetical protein
MTFIRMLVLSSPAALFYAFHSCDIPGTELAYINMLIPAARICAAHYAFPELLN